MLKNCFNEKGLAGAFVILLFLGLVVDYDKDELWFINSHESWSQVLSVGLDGKTTNVHVDNKTSTCNININTPSALAVYNNILYIANNDSSTILTATIVPGHTIENCKELRIGLDSITALKIFREIEGTWYAVVAYSDYTGCLLFSLPIK